MFISLNSCCLLSSLPWNVTSNSQESARRLITYSKHLLTSVTKVYYAECQQALDQEEVLAKTIATRVNFYWRLSKGHSNENIELLQASKVDYNSIVMLVVSTRLHLYITRFVCNKYWKGFINLCTSNKLSKTTLNWSQAKSSQVPTQLKSRFNIISCCLLRRSFMLLKPTTTTKLSIHQSHNRNENRKLCFGD